MEDLIPIGQFAAASRLSPKALRLYAENGLLPPARVDPDSGYRLYRLEQLRDATVIGLLRRAGMSLPEIGSFLVDRSLARLDAYERALGDELAHRCEVLRFVRRLLTEVAMFDVKTKQVEEQRFVSRSARVRIGELEQFIVSTVSELTKSHTVTDHAFTLYHGEVNEHSDGPVEVCLPTAAGDKCLPAGEVAFTVATGSHCDFPEIIGSYDAVACWAQEHGRKLDGPPREIYRFDPAQGEEPRMEIAWSIR